ncbi:MAG TPA: glycosyltransferase family 2 protein [Anaeromyxobacteraceae bacterium]|nr:glycosyltransferase family 2 protein [Anaeromyxobacteraceae bacterium]
MASPTLSICIATYNRADYIGQTLDSILPQLTDDVEVVVVDGASTDGTREVLERYAAGCPSLRYVRLQEKGGVDKDFCQAVEHARGEYCWLFADDDLVKPGAVRRLLEELAGGHSLVIVNSEVMDRDLSALLRASLLDIREDETYGPGDLEGLFRRIVPTVSFIGCVVIRRQTWLERDAAPYLGTEFVHVGVIFQAPLPGSARVIRQPCVSIRYGNAQWLPRAFEIWMVAWPRLIGSLERIPAEVRRKRVKPEPWRRLRTLRLYRALGGYTPQMYEKIIAPSNASRPWKWAARAISLLPQKAVNASMLWYYRTFRKRKLQLIYDLETSRRQAVGRRSVVEGRGDKLDSPG